MAPADAAILDRDIARSSDDGQARPDRMFPAARIDEARELDSGSPERVTVERAIEYEPTLNAEHDPDGVERLAHRALHRLNRDCGVDGRRRTHHGLVGVDRRRSAKLSAVGIGHE